MAVGSIILAPLSEVSPNYNHHSDTCQLTTLDVRPKTYLHNSPRHVRPARAALRSGAKHRCNPYVLPGHHPPRFNLLTALELPHVSSVSAVKLHPPSTHHLHPPSAHFPSLFKPQLIPHRSLLRLRPYLQRPGHNQRHRRRKIPCPRLLHLVHRPHERSCYRPRHWGLCIPIPR